MGGGAFPGHDPGGEYIIMLYIFILDLSRANLSSLSYTRPGGGG